MAKGLEVNQVIDNLLTAMVLPRMVQYGEKLDEVQDGLSCHEWVIDALRWLDKNGGARCDANNEWIKRALRK